MTRDSASGTGPETDPENEVTEASEATGKGSPQDATEPVKAPAATEETAAPTVPAPAEESRTATAGDSTPVAVDTTDDEPGDGQDTTDEGALGTSPADSGTRSTVAASSADASSADETTAGEKTAAEKTAGETPASSDTVPVSSESKPETEPVDGPPERVTQETPVPDLTLRPLPTPPGGQKITTPEDAEKPAEDPTPPDTSLTGQTVPVAETAPIAGTTPVTESTPVSQAAPVAAEGVPLAYASSYSEDPAAGQETLVNGTVPPPPATEKHATLVPLVGALVALAAIAALLIGAMALPIAKSKPHSVPVAVAGTKDITGQLTTLMQQLGGKDTFDIHVYSSQAELKKGIEDREVYGGLFVDNTQAQMMVATAAGIQVSDALQTVATTLQTQAQAQVTVTDVVAQPSKDARGDGLAATQLPLAVIAALPAFGLILLYRRRPLAQIGAGILASAAVGLATAAVLNYVSGSTSGGNYWLLAAGLTAGIFATTMILLGLNALAGRIGLGIGAAVIILLGAPLSGLSTVQEWLPDPWGTVGQVLPPGATATVLRSTAFFDGHGSKSALLVMLMWAAVGLVLLGLGTLLHRSNQRLADLKAEEQAAQLEAQNDEFATV